MDDTLIMPEYMGRVSSIPCKAIVSALCVLDYSAKCVTFCKFACSVSW